jgi:PAS domain-containing protein
MAKDTLVSTEAQALQAVLAQSPVAFSYFDPADRLKYWNRAYEALNFRIRHLIREGAYFPDLLAELVLSNQVNIPSGQRKQWVAERLEARSAGTTAFRELTNGRTFLVQERRDTVGGILGFWLDVTNLAETGALKMNTDSIQGTETMLSDHGKQQQIRSRLQRILGTLETLEAAPQAAGGRALLADAIAGVGEISRILDRGRRPEP